MDNKGIVLPELRFSGFEESWTSARLGDVCEINPNTRELPEEFIYIDLESVVDGQLLKERKISKYDAPSRAQRVLEKNDILFQMVRPYQKNNLFFDREGLYVASTGYAQIRTNLPSKFFYHLFHTDIFVNQVLKKCTGSNYPAINSSDLSNIIIHYPLSIIHSSKIASCLSSLDELIAAHSQKLELLKDHKKGLMQNLFPQEGEKVPKYRFKEFEKDREWSLKQLGVDNLIEIKGRIGYRGYTTEDIVSKGEGAISMSPSNIDENWNLNFEKSTYITWEKYEESPEIMLEDGFTALVKTGSSYGKAAYIKNLVEKTTINPQLVVLKPKQINSYFLYLLATNTAVQKQIQETVVGGAIPTLSQDSISKFEVLIPKPKEQQKIAECFSALNELIILQTQTIEQLKLHKKGLMQSLFPKIID